MILTNAGIDAMTEIRESVQYWLRLLSGFDRFETDSRSECHVTRETPEECIPAQSRWDADKGTLVGTVDV